MEVTSVRTTALGRIVERRRAVDQYRLAVERHLGHRVARAQDEPHEELPSYVERCFDWGISAVACARTWVAKGDGD